MSIRCPCGEINKDDSTFCSKCGRALVFRDKSKGCPHCGCEDPGFGIYCSRCKAFMDEGFPLRIPDTPEQGPSYGIAYVKYGNPESLYSWGGTMYVTKRQYFLSLAVSIAGLLFGVLLFALFELWYMSLLVMLLGIGSMYFWWLIGRKGARELGAERSWREPDAKR